MLANFAGRTVIDECNECNTDLKNVTIVSGVWCNQRCERDARLAHPSKKENGNGTYQNGFCVKFI